MLEDLETIRLQDALLEDRGGKVQRTIWPKADYTIGNPPLLVDKRLCGELGDEYVHQLFSVYRGEVRGGADLVCYFFEQEREAIAEAACELNDLRAHWLTPHDASEAKLTKRTLTNLYNARPTWLANAHARLDRAVWDAYGWPTDEVLAEVEEDTALSRLLALNQERAS